MTLQMHYQEKYEQGLEQGLERGREEEREQSKRQFALRMLEAGKLSVEEISMYSGLSAEQVLELEKEMQPV